MQQLLDRFDPAVLPTGPWLIWTERVRGRGAARRRYRRDVGIVDEDIVAVRAASDIVAIITKYTQLRRSGSRWVGLCPFHAEKTPSFSVNQELGVYRCWGCQVSGDARSEEHTSELQSLMRISYAVFCLKKTQREPHDDTVRPASYSPVYRYRHNIQSH